MSDYVVKFSGQDNLSGTLNKVKQELDKTGDAGSKLDRITDKFEKIANSAAPLKKEIERYSKYFSLDEYGRIK